MTVYLGLHFVVWLLITAVFAVGATLDLMDGHPWREKPLWFALAASGGETLWTGWLLFGH